MYRKSPTDSSGFIAVSQWDSLLSDAMLPSAPFARLLSLAQHSGASNRLLSLAQHSGARPFNLLTL